MLKRHVFKKTQRHVFQACLKNVAVLKRLMFQVQKNGTWLKKTAMTAVSFCFKWVVFQELNSKFKKNTLPGWTSLPMVELNKTIHVSQLCWRILLLRLAVLICSKTRYHVAIKSEMKANSTSGGDVLSFCSTWPLASFHYRNSYHVLFFHAFVLKPEVTKAASSFFLHALPKQPSFPWLEPI